jgi:hypothetical protein
MAQLMHCSALYKPKGSFDTRSDTSNALRSPAFLDTDHPALELMWTPKDVLEKLKAADKHRYAARILAGSKPAFSEKKKITRYWKYA